METPLTPLEFARRARKLHGRREAVVDGNLRLTYAEFGTRCDRWSAALAKLGVAKGDRVATIAPNTHQHLEQFYAIPQLGAVIVPINYRLSADDFVYVATHSGAKVLCVHGDYLNMVESVRARMPQVQHFVALEGDKAGWLSYEALIERSPESFGFPEIAETDLLSINYTSGTTSRPKGVMITHRNAWMNSVGTLSHWPLTPADRYLWTLPMFHANGWTFVWTVTAAGATHVCLRAVEASAIYEQVRRERVTHLCAAPTVLIGIANGPEESRSRLPRQYGLTETAPFISICEALPEHAALSCGDRATVKARQGVELITSGELRVVDGDMQDVAQDGATMGEIVARGNVVMSGYYNDPQATAAAFAGGWFHSGDGAVVHPDGYIEIRDRFKDVIISGGENISSIEVEGALLRHPAVLEVAVVGMPHEKWGESPHAFVILRAGESATQAELRDFARAALAHFKVPSAFHFVNELPKTATGKIQKFVLRGRRAAIMHQ